MVAEVSERRAPIGVRQTARLVEGVPTQVVAQSYADRVLILVTQMGKVGSLTQVDIKLASMEQIVEISPALDDGILPRLPVPFTSLDLTSLLGSPPPDLKALLDVYSAQIAMLVFTAFDVEHSSNHFMMPPQRPVIVGLALKARPEHADHCPSVDHERLRFGTIMRMVMDCKVW